MKKDRKKHWRWDEAETTKQIYSEGNTARQNETEDNNVSVLYELPKKKAKIKDKLLPTIFLVMFSAISIGLILGVVTLQMFGNIDETVNGDTNQTSVPAAGKIEAGLPILPSLSSYMIQAGVFSDETNAEKWQQDYITEAFPNILWERDGKWYLFIGIYHGEQEAQQHVNSLREEGFDVFVKQWATTEKELNVSGTDLSFLEEIASSWQQSLSNSDMNVLQEATGSLSENGVLDGLDNISSQEPQQYFLEWLYRYEKLGNESIS